MILVRKNTEEHLFFTDDEIEKAKAYIFKMNTNTKDLYTIHYKGF